MSRTDQETTSFTPGDDPVDIRHGSISAAPHDLLTAAANDAALELDLDCLTEPETALNPSPTNPLSLGDSRDLLFGNIEHVGDHAKEEDSINMAETVDPASDSQQSPESSQELKRVKVYELIGSRWVDQGTAYCFGQLDESNQAFLIARSEADFDKIILSTAIRSNDVYQRQQDSLIVWTEPDGADYALSFQDADGCAEVWNFIIEVQRHLNADQGLGSSSPAGDHSATTATIIRTGHLPSPQLGNIQDIEGAIKALARTQTIKERICEYIQREGYIKALIDVMTMAEDLESLDNLHALCSLMQTILMMNDHSIYEHILEDDIFFGVVGMLEYDPEFPTHKANYRDFLHNNTRFHQPIVIQDETIRKKVHHTFRLQFLKDVVLARILDDSTFNVLNSCIIFNQIDIINHVQQDPVFLQEIVRLYVSEEVLAGPRKDGEETDATGSPNGAVANGRHPSQMAPFSFDPPGPLTESDNAFRGEVVLLIQQLCVMGKNIQLPARMALFRTLVDRGILFAVQWAFGLNERESTSKIVINAASEIMSALLDHDLHGIRSHVFKQAMAIEREREAERIGADKAETLLKLMCRIITQSRDLAVQCQIGDALKALLDISQNAIGPGTTPSALGAKFSARPKDDPGTEKFLDYFYKHCIEVLFKPYGDIPDFRKQTDAEPTLKLSREKTNLFLYLCDLLCIFAQQHTFRSHFYMLSSNISTRVAALLSARDKHLRLSAFRFFRICLKLNNKNFLNHLTKLDVFKPILDLALQESCRDSLLSASCQEFFEHMRRENIKDLVNHCMTKHETIVRQLATTPTGGARFSAFIRRWEINIEPPPKEETQPDRDIRDSRRMGRAIDAEEENYFNEDDDDSDQPPPFISSSSHGSRSSAVLGALRRKRRGALVASKISLRPQNFVLPRTPQLSALVDYGDEDEDAESAQESVVASARESSPLSGSDIPPSPRLAHRQISRPSNIPRRRSLEEDENLLESITRTKPVTASLPADASTSSPKPSLQFPRIGEKRRREDDDEEGLLERLASKPKRTDVGTHKDDDTVSGRAKPPAKQGDDPPKRIKVMFRPLSIAITQQPSSPVPSEAAAKDGDTG